MLVTVWYMGQDDADQEWYQIHTTTSDFVVADCSRLDHPENYLFSLPKSLFLGSRYPKIIFNSILKIWLHCVWPLTIQMLRRMMSYAASKSCTWSTLLFIALWPVLPFQPKHRLVHLKNYLFSSSKKIFSGSKYLKNIWFNFEKGSTDHAE